MKIRQLGNGGGLDFGGTNSEQGTVSTVDKRSSSCS